MIPLRTWLGAPFRFARSIARSAWHGLMGYPVIAPDYERERRLAICHFCRHYQNGMCEICACIVEAKVFLSSEQCPDTPPRWLRLMPELESEDAPE